MSERPIIMLGIETSCDETAAAIVASDKTVYANEIASQIECHSKHGGVVPEIAARQHLEAIDFIILRALRTSGFSIADIDAIAATGGPGLIGGVAVGTVVAKAISAARKIPFYAINHLEGHALSPRLVNDFDFPYLLLLISGGHTQLLAVLGPGNYVRYGTTLDDAAGEALDKCAKTMGLGYPGGPEIEKIAKTGDAEAISLPRPLKGKPGCRFSFSGLKTAVVRQFRQLGGHGVAPINDLAASLQFAIADCLSDRTLSAMERFLFEFQREPFSRPTLVVAGGVAANNYFSQRFMKLSEEMGFTLHIPPLDLCTDNAAMIAWAAIERYGSPDPLDFEPCPRWPLDPNADRPPGRGVRQ